MRYIWNKINQSLLIQILLAIIFGFLVGLVAPRGVVRVFYTFSTFFGDLLSFSIPLILFGLIASTIASLGKQAGKMLLLAVFLSYVSSLGAGIISFFVSAATFPHLVSSKLLTGCIGGENVLTPYFKIDMIPITDATSALVLAIILGLGGTLLNESSPLRKVMEDFKFLMEKFISTTIVPCLPFYIFSLFVAMTFNGNMAPVFVGFSKIIGVIIVLHVGILLLQFLIAGVVVWRNPLKLLKTMLPAYLTALGTQSSAATIPVTLKQTLKNGVSNSVAGFVIPLCATTHLSGSVLKIISCAVALMIMTNTPYDFELFIGFIMMLCIMAVAAPGIPGGAIMAALPILSSILGFSPELQSLMISLYAVMDPFGTACNVTGDGAIALIMDKVYQKEQE